MKAPAEPETTGNRPQTLHCSHLTSRFPNHSDSSLRAKNGQWRQHGKISIRSGSFAGKFGDHLRSGDHTWVYSGKERRRFCCSTLQFSVHNLPYKADKSKVSCKVESQSIQEDKTMFPELFQRSSEALRWKSPVDEVVNLHHFVEGSSGT